MKRYIVLSLCFAATLLALVFTFNYRVDPYLLFHHRNGGSDLLSRVDQFYNMRLYKPYHVARRRPQNLIIGSSRSAALWPESAEWEGESSYNFSMPGLTMFELKRSVEHAHTVGPLSRLIVGLDYQAFVRSSPKYRPGFAPARMRSATGERYQPAYIGQRLTDLHSLLLSAEITAESLQATFQNTPVPRRYFPNGVWEDSSRNLVGRGGYIYVGKSAIGSIVASELRPRDNLAHFRELLRFCHRSGIETTLFFTPTHLFFVDLWFRVGSEELWRDTHRQVVEINQQVAGEFGRQPYPLWGFGDQPEIVAEPIYRARDIDKAWFMDGVHASRRLAERIMKALQARGESTLGRQLDAGNIDDYLADIVGLRAGFLASDAATVAQLHRAIGLNPTANKPTGEAGPDAE